MTEELRIKLDLNSKRFRKGLKNAQKGVARLNGAMKMIGIGATVGGIMKLGSSLMTLADDLGTNAAKLGVTTDYLQELGYAAEQSGISSDTATMGFQRFARRLAQAQAGGGELNETLHEMGIAVHNADGSTRSATEVFRDFADGIAATDDPQQRLLRGFKAFDSEGVALVAMLEKGSAGFDQLAREAHEAGVVLEEDAIKEIDQADKFLKRFGQRATVVFAKFLRSAVRAFKVGQKFAENFFTDLFVNLDSLGSAFGKLIRLDFDGFAKDLGDAMSNSRSMGEMFEDAVKHVDKQFEIERKISEEKSRQKASMQQITEQSKKQQEAAAKMQAAEQKRADAMQKLRNQKRDRSLMTLEELAAKDGKLEKTDPVVAALRKQLAFSQQGLDSKGKTLTLTKEQERNLLLAEKANLYEQLGKSLANQMQFGRSQRAFAMADQIRKMTPYLKSGERNPLKVAEDQLRTANDQLEVAKRQLETTRANFPLKMAP